DVDLLQATAGHQRLQWRAIDKLLSSKLARRRQPGIAIIRKPREDDPPLVRIGRARAADAFKIVRVKILLDHRPVLCHERLAVAHDQHLPDRVTIAVEGIDHGWRSHSAFTITSFGSPASMRIGFRNGLPKFSNAITISSPSSSFRRWRKLKLSAPKKWMWASPGTRCQPCLK